MGWGPDLSVPRGDRDEPAPPAGPAAVRAALGLPFHQQVADLARELGWKVFDRRPELYLVKGETMIVAYTGPAAGWQVSELLARLNRVTRVRTHHWPQADGLAAVEAALGGEQA